MNEDDYDARDRAAFVRGLRQVADPARCRETHPEHGDIECTRERAHFEVERTPHVSEVGVEWFALLCPCVFDSSTKQCPICRGSLRRLISREEVEAAQREEESAS